MKKAVKKKSTKSSRTKNQSMEKILIENFVSLQKVLTNLSEKFDNLAKQSSELLKLFEDSAKTIIKRDFQPLPTKQINLSTKEMESKLDKLLEQNKIIAKGLTLIHETAKNPEINYSIGTTFKAKETPPTMRPPQNSRVKPIVREDTKRLVREDPNVPAL